MATSMKTTSIRFRDDILTLIHKQAQLDGKNATEYMRDAILEKLEDSLDYGDAVRNIEESKGKTVSRSEVKRQLGL